MHHRMPRTVQCLAVAMALLVSGQALAAGGGDFPSPPPPDPDVYLDRSGFNELIINQIFFGAQIGSALTTAVFTDDLRQASGALLGLGAGIALPILLTRGSPVPSGDVVYINQLQRLGLMNGLLAFGLIEPSISTKNTWRTSQGLMAGLSLLGLGAALATKDHFNLMPGQASALGAGYFYSLITGGALLFILDVAETNQEATFGTLLGFANAGLIATFLLRDHLQVDRGRIFWTTLGAGVGSSVGLGLGWLLGGDDATFKFMSATTLAGFWAGAALTFVYFVPPDGFRNRTSPGSTSLVALNEQGNLALGLPVPTPVLLPSRLAGQKSELAATVNLFEWRSR